MKKIVSPLKLKMKSSQVADLHQALSFLGLEISDTEKDSHRFGPSTRDAVRTIQKDQQSVTGIVDEGTAKLINSLLVEGGAFNEEITYVIKGVVHSADGKPAADLTVQAFDRDISGENLLGATTTDHQGTYRIPFTEAQFKRSDSERGGPEVYIRVSDNARQQLGQSKTIKNAPKELNLDLTLAAGSLEVLNRKRLVDLVIAAIGDKPEVVGTILEKTDIKAPCDLANLGVKELMKLIAPEAKLNSKEYKHAKEQATKINNQSFAREPLAVVQRMTKGREISFANDTVRTGLATFLQTIPAGTDVRRTPIHKVLTGDALEDVPEEHRAAVVDHAKALWRTVAVTPPDAPHVPPILMKHNLTSAFHIGEMPESVFMELFGKEKEMGVDTARQVYTNAVNTRIRNEHALITMREAVRGTGLAAIDGKSTRIDRMAVAMENVAGNNVQLNLDKLFEDMDYCECKECQSVYSASAYFVELLNFLRNNNLGPDPQTGDKNNPNIKRGIAGTPLEKLFHRRPDLGDLELTCENTKTVLPYIDLVNEVMESYVVNRVDWASSKPKLTAFNVTDETTAELLAEPQHTDYHAYCILKNDAVYPFNLPFHQPIEAARIFLKYLGTSRYEVLDTFRTAHEAARIPENRKLFTDDCPTGNEEDPPEEGITVVEKTEEWKAQREEAWLDRIAGLDGMRPKPPKDSDEAKEQHGILQRLDNLHAGVLDRAADAEYLGLTQEEYIILTREAFWPKEYFDLTQKTDFSKVDYQQKIIGVKPQWAYYGYATEAAMLDTNEDPVAGRTGLKFVKNAFLPRTGIEYTDLVELLKTRFINPRYPKGLALAIFQNIQSSYRFLKKLVNSDPNITDPRIKFARLVEFLETYQSWDSVPQVLEAFPRITSPKVGPSHVNPIIRKWVYCCFEKLGELIVLESGEAPQLPIEGDLFVVGANKSCAALHCDGTIGIPGVLVGKVSVVPEKQEDGTIVALAGPVHWNGIYTQWANNSHYVKSKDGTVIGGIDSQGLWLPRPVEGKDRKIAWISPKDTCDLNKVRLIHLDGAEVAVADFDRMQRFIRLWRKLGWSIDEVDKALEGLATNSQAAGLPTSTKVTPHVDFKQFKDTCRPCEECPPICPEDEEVTCDITSNFLHQLVAVKKLLERTGLPLIKLLTFWSDISTSGEKSLYSSLFLNHNMLRSDAVFKADDNGIFLNGSTKIIDHLPALMAAMKLKADDITAIVGPDALLNAKLTLKIVSQIYRCSLLAKILHIKTSDIADLAATFGEPFLPGAIATLELFNVWEKMENAGFTFRQLTYAIKDLDDPRKPLAPPKKNVLTVAKTLYEGLTAIEKDNGDVSDPAQATTELVRAKAGQLFESQTIEGILGLLEGTTVYTVEAPINQQISIPAALAKKFAYVEQKDECNPQAWFKVTGILTDDELKDLSDDPAWSPAIEQAYKQAEGFFNDVLADILPAFPTSDDDKQNFRLHPLEGDVIVPLQPDQLDPNTAPLKRSYFLHYYLPILRERLERRLIIDIISAVVGLTGDITELLLSEPLQAVDHDQPAMTVLQNIKHKPTNAVGWKGYLIPSADDKYTFVIIANSQPAAIGIDGQPFELTNQQSAQANIWLTASMPLKAGKLYPFTVTDRDISTLKWRTSTSPATPIPTSTLLPDFTDAGTREVFVKLCKAAFVVNGFNLKADEASWFQANKNDFCDFNFNAISLKSWQRIADYAALRDALPKTDMTLLDLFAWSKKPDNIPLTAQIAKVTQWQENIIASLIADNHFDLNRPAAFHSEKNLVTLRKAITVADKVGVNIDRLFVWAAPGSKFWPSHTNAMDIRMAMHARFNAEDWEKAVRPLNNQLREMQKQALISFLLIQPALKAWPVHDADSLFEFFLIDVQMGAERHTSRMVQAISSVQLFIKRCLLGLEDKIENGKQIGVPATAIDRKRWEWMQKYRVWEANRKVYLYPENWIHPGLRDDKSQFYKELESELLQKDVNTQTVQDALKNYLYKVDEVANLQVIGLYIEPASNYGSDNKVYSKLHVFGRTRHAPYILYYRFFDIGESNWYPWEKMQVDIPSYDAEDTNGQLAQNGSYLIPVVWNKRLLVFFPQLMKKTIPSSAANASFRKIADSNSTSLKPNEIWEIKMAWSEYRNGKWTPKQVTADAIYNIQTPEDNSIIDNSIISGPDLATFRFVPIITDNAVMIDIYCDDETVEDIPQITTQSPKIARAVLSIYTYNDGKDDDTNYFVKVYTSGGIEIANLDAAGQGIAYGYDPPSSRDITMNILDHNITMDKCKGFKVSIQQHTAGDDTWIFDAKVTLTFRDESNSESTLVADRQGMKLVNDRAGDDFESLDK